METNQKKSSLQFLIHFLVWGIITSFPLIFLYSEGEKNLLKYFDFSLPIIFLMIVFYSNYLYLIPKFLFNRKIWQFFLVNAVLFSICLFAIDSIKQLYFDALFANMDFKNHMPPRAKMKEILQFRDFISMSLTVGLAVAIRMTIQWYQSQAEQKELEKLHLASELNNLKHQLSPHFLFNTLNNIYSLISINQDNAQTAVHQLSNLIRYVLYESEQPKVFLSKDLDFTNNYIRLMSLRLASNVKLQTNIMTAEEGMTVAPLLFMTLVENAFKHGISPDQPSNISISIQKAEPGQLVCKVVNSNFPKNENDKSGSGIGLNNLRKRLELLYPDAHQIHTEVKDNVYSTTLTLNI